MLEWNGRKSSNSNSKEKSKKKKPYKRDVSVVSLLLLCLWHNNRKFKRKYLSRKLFQLFSLFPVTRVIPHLRFFIAEWYSHLVYECVSLYIVWFSQLFCVQKHCSGSVAVYYNFSLLYSIHFSYYSTLKFLYISPSCFLFSICCVFLLIFLLLVRS